MRAARQRHMRLETARLRRLTGARHRLLHLGLQPGQRGLAIHAGPQRAQLAALAEAADAGERKLELRHAQRRQGLVDILRVGPLHLAQKTQGEVIVVGRRPMQAGQSGGQTVQIIANRLRQSEGDKETHGDISLLKTQASARRANS